MDLNDKINTLRGIISRQPSILISYSGGVDSALLAILVHDTLGPERMQCVLVDSPGLGERSRRDAVAIAEAYALPLTIVSSEPLSEQNRAENSRDRCRLCKKGICEIIRDAAEKSGLLTIADGSNVSDLDEYRPGIEASTSCGVIHPFIMAGITKTDIREIARMKNLSFWSKPSSACLYSRIPYGIPITTTNLRMVEEAEEYLQDLGFTQVRVRHHDTIARIELLPDEIPGIIDHYQEIDRHLRLIGYHYVTVDLRGYRSGSLDETPGKPG